MVVTATTTHHVAATPERVCEVLSDPRSYECRVVGCREIHQADADFPARGTLRARARPTGIGHVTLELVAPDRGTEVSITEVPVEGIAAGLHDPVHDGLIRMRNLESLRRLKRLAQRD